MGRNLLAEFYCGYTRNVADSAAKGGLDLYDGFLLADHCIQLLGAVDVVRSEMPDTPVFLGQLLDVDDRRLGPRRGPPDDAVVRRGDGPSRRRAGHRCGARPLRSAVCNENRRLLREVFAARRAGNAALTSSQMQVLVKSSMVMDSAEHTALLRQADRRARGGAARRPGPAAPVRAPLPRAPARAAGRDRGVRRARRRRRPVHRVPVHLDRRAPRTAIPSTRSPTGTCDAQRGGSLPDPGQARDRLGRRSWCGPSRPPAPRA